MEIVEAATKAGVHALKIQTCTPDTMTLDLDAYEFDISDPNSLKPAKSFCTVGPCDSLWSFFNGSQYEQAQ